MPGWGRLRCLRWGSAAALLGNWLARDPCVLNLQQIAVVALSPDRFPSKTVQGIPALSSLAWGDSLIASDSHILSTLMTGLWVNRACFQISWFSGSVLTCGKLPEEILYVYDGIYMYEYMF